MNTNPQNSAKQKDSKPTIVISVSNIPPQNQAPPPPPLIKITDNNKPEDLCLWKKSPRELEDAPEINILYKKKHPVLDDTNSTCIHKLTNRIIKFFGMLCKHRVTVAYGLANYKPINARTNNTLEYIKECVTKYSKPTITTPQLPPIKLTPAPPAPSKASTNSIRPPGSITNNKQLQIAKKGAPPPSRIPSTSSNASSNKSQSKFQQNKNVAITLGSKHQLLKQFYEKAYQTLQHLQKATGLYKEMVLSLSFTRYSEFKLTGSEFKLAQGKSIIGSCMWVVTCALKQLQDDPAIEPFETLQAQKSKPNSLIADIAADLFILVNLSLETWNETVLALSNLEKIHLKTEELFKKQTSIFQNTANPDSVEAITANVHLKKYRRSRTQSLEISRFGSAVTGKGGPFWNKKYNYPRILYKTDYAKPHNTWNGFDPLPVQQKVNHIKELLRFVQRVLKLVKEAAQKISVEFQGTTGTGSCYQKGIGAMEELLKKSLAHIDWTPQDTQEFFEMDKIFLDDIDCLTMGAGLVRTILHDARHTLHICYETTRLLNFKEFISLPEYGKVTRMYYKARDEQAKFKGKKFLTVDQESLKRASNTFDIEELQVDMRNLNALFSLSPYYEVVKTLPIYCMKLGVTLQDTDFVFTPSSERLLTVVRPVNVD